MLAWQARQFDAALAQFIPGFVQFVAFLLPEKVSLL
jgi:hypothetical protein